MDRPPCWSFDKVLLSMDGSIRGLFLLVKGYLGIEKQGLAMLLGKVGGAAADILRNRLTF
jgi:hypothetical protein